SVVLPPKSIDLVATETTWTTPSTTASRTTENQRAFKDTPHKGKPSNFILTVNAHWSEQALVTFVEAPHNGYRPLPPERPLCISSSPAYRPSGRARTR